MLQNQILELNLRGLSSSAKWLSTLQLALMNGEECVSSMLPSLSVSFLHVKSLFDCKEFGKISHFLGQNYSQISDERSLFLLFFSRWMEVCKQEALGICNSFASDDSTSASEDEFSLHFKQQIHQKFAQILSDISSITANKKDAFICYLEACIRNRLNDKKGAFKACVQSLNANPSNWDCWCLLGKVVASESKLEEVISSLRIPSEWQFMLKFFEIQVLLALQLNPQKCEILISQQEKHFSSFSYIRYCKALLRYNERAFPEASSILCQILQEDPFFFEAGEILSNIHFLNNDKEALASLALQFYQIDPLRAESCVIAGNFHSLRQEPILAIQQFQKAIKLNPLHLSAWVLMGHEYLELRSTSAAIRCYRKALQGDSRDHRAWYALGQTYELLKMNSYALFYYSKAVEYKPLDARMWSALSTIHQHLGDFGKAIATLRQAISLQPSDVTLRQRIATLLLKSFDQEAAIKEYEIMVEIPAFWTQLSSQDICAILWKLALNAYQHQKWNVAKDYCNKILELNEMEREGAQELLELIAKKESSFFGDGEEI